MLLRSQNKKLIRLEEHHRLGRVSEHTIGDKKVFVLERANDDGSVTELDQLEQSNDGKLKFTDLEKTPLTEATVLGREVSVPEGVLGILEFSLMIQADVATRNNTLYPLKDVKREFRAYNKEYVKGNKAWGGFKHPGWLLDDYRVEFDNAAVRWFVMEFDEETGIISGAGFLLDKKEGTDIRAGIRSGGIVGVSSRGWGWGEKFSEYEGIHGTIEDVWVIEDWILEGFDIVTDNSAFGAETDQFFTESAKRRAAKQENAARPPKDKEPPKETEPMKLTLEKLKTDHSDLYKGVMAEGRSEGRVELQTELEASAPARREAITKELTEGDASKLVPRADFDAAKVVVQENQAQVETLTSERDEALAKLEETTTERDELKGKVEKAEADKSRAEVKAAVEAVLAGHSHKEAVRSRLTDEDLSTIETATEAIEREFKWLLDNFNIPKEPISAKQLERLGKTDNKKEDEPGQPEEKTPGQKLAEKSRRMGL